MILFLAFLIYLTVGYASLYQAFCRPDSEELDFLSYLTEPELREAVIKTCGLPLLVWPLIVGPTLAQRFWWRVHRAARRRDTEERKRKQKEEGRETPPSQ